ncbi:unnamed protein product [Urochloa humidicola]
MTGLYKGYGFIQFALLEDAKAAQSLNGQLDIAGRVIKVSAVCSDLFSSTCSSNWGFFASCLCSCWKGSLVV